ncbi:MAG: PilZ domain-containing protein, partial [Boseongicola sp.]|nr:PilZ domain-containing protein [Boseongicola sp.]
MAVRLIVDGENVAATLLDISRDGAKLSVPYAVLPGSAVELLLESASIPALV